MAAGVVLPANMVGYLEAAHLVSASFMPMGDSVLVTADSVGASVICMACSRKVLS